MGLLSHNGEHYDGFILTHHNIIIDEFAYIYLNCHINYNQWKIIIIYPK